MLEHPIHEPSGGSKYNFMSHKSSQTHVRARLKMIILMLSNLVSRCMIWRIVKLSEIEVEISFDHFQFPHTLSVLSSALMIWTLSLVDFDIKILHVILWLPIKSGIGKRFKWWEKKLGWMHLHFFGWNVCILRLEFLYIIKFFASSEYLDIYVDQIIQLVAFKIT